jgi:hypothetical protein
LNHTHDLNYLKTTHTSHPCPMLCLRLNLLLCPEGELLLPGPFSLMNTSAASIAPFSALHHCSSLYLVYWGEGLDLTHWNPWTSGLEQYVLYIRNT